MLTFSLRVGKVVVERVTVVKFRANDEGGDGNGSFEVVKVQYAIQRSWRMCRVARFG